ncbi:DUF202 domain-containing protein [Streptomyces sp. OF3]|uniref:DUF202 domain-containing protein n=2 Tax=Streptomyces alkaliterrae TaxID=2213162 RepID=A0A7W3ZMS5_9ACTN|nr:DUF202 domain-containing protein [Streptomyces alkaliterrae]MBB1258062.1 DUF202 domain-containing protein [Streptomyces alkaliterrae]
MARRGRAGAGRRSGRFRAAVMMWFSPSRMEAEGTTPDYRFSLANERTFLAWIRTALALVAGGIAVDQFLTDLTWGLRTSIAVALFFSGAVCALRAVHRWVVCERAMRRGEDLPSSPFPAMLAVGTAVASLLVALAIVFGVTR